MVVSACAMAFAHGSNDVANAIGPLAAIVSTVNSNGVIDTSSPVQAWILLGATGIVFGLSMLGKNVIKTVGEKITTLKPSLGFSAELATATTVVVASYVGFPISTTHTLVGGVIGVGLARGAEHLNTKSITRIITSMVNYNSYRCFFNNPVLGFSKSNIWSLILLLCPAGHICNHSSRCFNFSNII